MSDIGRTRKATLGLAVPEQEFLSRLGGVARGGLEMHREDAAGGRLQGDFAEVGGEGGEEFLGELERVNSGVSWVRFR